MKITYNFVNGETIAVEVNDEIGRIILDMRKKEENEERRIRYNERHIDLCLDHGSWNEYVQPEFNDEIQEQEERKTAQQEQARKAIDALTEDQKVLVVSLYGDTPMKSKDYAEKKGVTPAAITKQTNRIRKKLKKFL